MVFEDEIIMNKKKAKELAVINGMAYRTNPKAKYVDYITPARFFGIIIAIIGMIMLAVYKGIRTFAEPGNVETEKIKMFLLVGLLFVALMIGLIIKFLGKGLLMYNKILKSGNAKEKTSLDREKIVHEIAGDKVVVLHWDSISFVRKFDEYIAFMPKKPEGMMIAIETKHFDEVKNFIKDNLIFVTVVE